MINIILNLPQSFKHNYLIICDHSQKIHKTFSSSRFISTKFVSKSHHLKILEVMNQNQFYKFNCLCHVFSQVTYVCSRGYKSISSATHEEFPKITKFVSWHHFAKPIQFPKQNQVRPKL